MAIHVSILAWRIPWREVGYSLGGCKQLETTEQLTHTMKITLQSTDRVKNLIRGMEEKIFRGKVGEMQSNWQRWPSLPTTGEENQNNGPE